MAEKKDIPISPSNERLQLWLSFAKFCIAVFFISVTVMNIAKEDVKARLKIASIENGDGGNEVLTKKLGSAKDLYYQGVDQYVNNNIAGAIASWEKVLKVDPNHAEAKKNIERARAKMLAQERLNK